MSRVTDDSRERVREAVDFVELVGARTELRRAGVNRYTGLCPFHDERSPSFGIDPIEKLYHCFGCGAGGDVFKFVMETENVGFGEALEMLADRYGVELEREAEDPGAARRRGRRERLHALLERTAAWYVRMLWESDEAAPAREYLASRGLDENVLREFRVGYSPASWDRVVAASARAGFTVEEIVAAGLATRGREGKVFDRFRGRLMFPLCDMRGRVLGFGARALAEGDRPKYLNSSEGELFRKGRMVFATHIARAPAAKSGTVILAEGYTDVIALHQSGMRNAVGLMGTALTADQGGELGKLARTVVLCLDADAAGQEAMAKAAGVLASAGLTVRVAPLPPGSDPADLLAAEGIEAMRRRVDGAVPIARWQVERALAGDLDAAEARDAALAAVAPVIGPLPSSVLKEELIRLVAGRLALGEALVAERLRAAAARPAAPRTRTFPQRQAHRGGGRADAEHGFLAYCIALPDEGRRRLAEADLDGLFTAEVIRRAAELVRDHADEPSAAIPPGDDELAAVVAELVLRARSIEEPSSGDLARAALYLDLARLERTIAAARVEGRPLSDLALERQDVLARLRRLTV